MNYTIREIQPKDDRLVEHIIRTCLLEFGGDREGTAWCDPDLSRFSEIYTGDGRKYWVAVDGTDTPVGGAGIGPLPGAEGVCELQKMYCLPTARGTGAAHRLLELCLDYARQFYHTCYLETFGNMLAAHKFYAKHGFTRLDAPLCDTGHFSCDVWCAKALRGALVLPYTAGRIGDVLDFEGRLRQEEDLWGWEIDGAYAAAVEKSFTDPRFAHSLSLLAYVDGRVAGRIDSTLVCSHFDGSVKAYLDWICVLSSQRHRGIARALMAELRRRLKEAGADTLIGLVASNPEAQRFYRSLENAEIRDEGIWIGLQ